MRLLSTKDYSFHEFHHQLPRYAILSHTWGDEEVSYQEWATLLTAKEQRELSTANLNIRLKQGYSKIIKCCQIALKNELAFAWIDTCCIDKSSSAELSEAINSMFDWYKQSHVCYAYLSDVSIPANTKAIIKGNDGTADLHPRLKESLTESRWFTRGWTLQELIAPREVRFYAKTWVHLGNKTHGKPSKDVPDLNGELSEITGVLPNFLLSDDLHHASVAQKMSWASRRQTTRIEDRAYCLMGLFGVNMPLLYGEGERSFLRLQEEIIKVSDCHSIFAWDERAPSQIDGFENEWPGSRSGLLAPSPIYFDNAGKIVSILGKDKRPYSMTNTGLQIELEFLEMKISSGWGRRHVAILDCHYANDYRGPLAITIDLDSDYHTTPLDKPLIASRRNLGISPMVLDITREASNSATLLRLMSIPQNPTDPKEMLWIRPPRLFFETYNGPLPGYTEQNKSGVKELVILRAWPEQQFQEIGELFANCTVREASVLIAIQLADGRPAIHAIVTAIRCPLHSNDHLHTTIDLVADVASGHTWIPGCCGRQMIDVALHRGLVIWSQIGHERRVSTDLVVVKVGVWKPTHDQLTALLHKHPSGADITHPIAAVEAFRSSLGLANGSPSALEVPNHNRSRSYDRKGIENSHIRTLSAG